MPDQGLQGNRPVRWPVSVHAGPGPETPLTLHFLVAVVNALNTKTRSSKEMAQLSFENADVKSIR